ncbi:MAG: ABC transporter substrate-binding protein [Eubacteriales bacterium]|nr:ABC transporter substrate-binding protein [Eubacteriales bacterium]
MKKVISLLLAAMLVLSMAACGSTSANENTDAEAAVPAGTEAADAADEETTDAVESEDAEEPAEVTVTGMDAAGEPIEVTVPYKPERVVVLDLANLDILDNLGLGDRVVGVPTITLPYLQSYNENGLPIVGSVKTPDLEAVMACEPDLILMGGRMAEYIDDLGEIAPVLRLTTVSDDGLVEAIRGNAKTIGAIFGETEQVDALLAQYDARIAALNEFAEGRTCVLGMSTSGSFNLLGNDGRCSLIVNEIGFDNIGADAASVGGERSGSGRGGSESAESSEGSTPTHGNEVSFEAIVALNPEYIFVMDRDSAIGTSGAQLAAEIMENELIMKTDAYQNGNLVILENPGIWYLAEGGITSLGIMLDDLENALLK